MVARQCLRPDRAFRLLVGRGHAPGRTGGHRSTAREALPSPQVHNEVTTMNSGRPILFRNATVLSMDPAIGVLEGGDVLVRAERIEQVGRDLPAPDDAEVIDATGGIVLPGMIDTHRHMWQTALRGFGADW